jgi:hypothetical protein
MTSAPTKIVGRSKRLHGKQRDTFNRVFKSADGWVLDFSDRTMAEWFDEHFGLSIFQPRFQIEGPSKGKSLRGFVEVAEPRLVANVLRAMWAYRCSQSELREADPAEEERLKLWLVHSRAGPAFFFAAQRSDRRFFRGHHAQQAARVHRL